jgi:CCR4-NOT transcription complex subunit 7/8
MTSGLVLVEDVRWISFHSAYDFGYLLQILTCKPLPDDEADFRDSLELFFPCIYDMKYLVKNIARTSQATDSAHSSRTSEFLERLGSKPNLSEIAKEMNIARVGQSSHAGSDALLTGRVFFELLRTVFDGQIDDDVYLGQIWGLNGVGTPASAATTAAFTAAAQGHSGASGANGSSSSYANGAAPSTPDAHHAGLVGTPSRAPSTMGPLTPGGGGGAFGAFQFGK